MHRLKSDRDRGRACRCVSSGPFYLGRIYTSIVVVPVTLISSRIVAIISVISYKSILAKSRDKF